MDAGRREMDILTRSLGPLHAFSSSGMREPRFPFIAMYKYAIAVNKRLIVGLCVTQPRLHTTQHLQMARFYTTQCINRFAEIGHNEPQGDRGFLMTGNPGEWTESVEN
jgi:hypothetical protein